MHALTPTIRPVTSISLPPRRGATTIDFVTGIDALPLAPKAGRVQEKRRGGWFAFVTGCSFNQERKRVIYGPVAAAWEALSARRLPVSDCEPKPPGGSAFARRPRRLFSTRLPSVFQPFLALALALLVGCASVPAYKTLYGVGHTTDAAVKTYFDLVVAGKVPTNSVPRISRAYGEFQTLYGVALTAAQFNPNAPADTNLVARSAALLADVAAAKGGAR